MLIPLEVRASSLSFCSGLTMNNTSELQHCGSKVVFCLTARLDRGSLWREEQKVLAVLDALRSISSVHFRRGGHVSVALLF